MVRRASTFVCVLLDLWPIMILPSGRAYQGLLSGIESLLLTFSPISLKFLLNMLFQKRRVLQERCDAKDWRADASSFAFFFSEYCLLNRCTAAWRRAARHARSPGLSCALLLHSAVRVDRLRSVKTPVSRSQALYQTIARTVPVWPR